MDASVKDLVAKLDILCNYVDDLLATEPIFKSTDTNTFKIHIKSSRDLMAKVWAMEGKGTR